MSKYDHLEKDALVRLLQRRDAERKPGREHPDYGRVVMVGRKRNERDFTVLRELGGRLQSAGGFSVEQLRFG